MKMSDGGGRTRVNFEVREGWRYELVKPHVEKLSAPPRRRYAVGTKVKCVDREEETEAEREATRGEMHALTEEDLGLLAEKWILVMRDEHRKVTAEFEIHDGWTYTLVNTRPEEQESEEEKQARREDPKREPKKRTIPGYNEHGEEIEKAERVVSAKGWNRSHMPSFWR
jgi:hypothetical protein